MKKSLIVILSLFINAVSYIDTLAQDEAFQVPATNSHATIQQGVAATDIKVDYNRPSVKGRTIFGELVPYGQVWRTGSDSSTKISFSTPVSINGKAIDAGTYELFTIPDKEQWTIILQQNRSQWGSYAYDSQYDVARVAAKPTSIQETVETFTIGFANVTSSAATLELSWEKVKVSMQITIDLEETVLPQLERSLEQEGRKPYFRAAMFYYENDLDIERAAELMELAIGNNPKHIGMLYRQALILERKGDIKGAIAASQKSFDEAQKLSGELRKEYTKLNTALLARLKE